MGSSYGFFALLDLAVYLYLLYELAQKFSLGANLLSTCLGTILPQYFTENNIQLYFQGSTR